MGSIFMCVRRRIRMSVDDSVRCGEMRCHSIWKGAMKFVPHVAGAHDDLVL